MLFSSTDSISSVLVERESMKAKKDKAAQQKDFICRRTLKERAEAHSGALNLSEEIDWGKPVGSELWQSSSKTE